MDFSDDIPAFLADFGETVTFVGVGDAVAIFDRDYAVAAVGEGYADSRPALQLATTSVPASPKGKRVIVRGVTWEVAEHMPDGQLLSVLLLQKP